MFSGRGTQTDSKALNIWPNVLQLWRCYSTMVVDQRKGVGLRKRGAVSKRFEPKRAGELERLELLFLFEVRVLRRCLVITDQQQLCSISDNGLLQPYRTRPGPFWTQYLFNAKWSWGSFWCAGRLSNCAATALHGAHPSHPFSLAPLLFKQLQVRHSLAYIIERVKHQREKSNAECNPHGQAGMLGNVDLCYFNCL